MGFIILTEMVFGMTGFLATFHFSMFIVLAAIISVKSRITPLQGLLLAAITTLVLSGAILRTATKADFRSWLADGTEQQASSKDIVESTEWLLRNSTMTNETFFSSSVLTLERIAYTTFLAITIERKNLRILDPTAYWLEAIQHVTMPRLLFPDKRVL
ncbi:hypothetical protein WDZ92_54465, partial [Nostoc sp. NIES-2111]